MPGTSWRPALMAFAVSAPVIALVIGGRVAGSESLAHASAFVALICGLPWVIPAFVVVAVLSAPIYVALHIAGLPQELMPWLSAVILIAAIWACHFNATLLFRALLRRPTRSQDAGLADFLLRSRARIG
jgi:hypothetical protein